MYPAIRPGMEILPWLLAIMVLAFLRDTIQ